jgi:hypothetical protein
MTAVEYILFWMQGLEQMQRLQEENGKLRAQLEAQYKQMIEMAEVIQQSYIPRIVDASSDAELNNGRARDYDDVAGAFHVRAAVLCRLVRG